LMQADVTLKYWPAARTVVPPSTAAGPCPRRLC